MGRFKTAFEIRERLHELSHIFARNGISRLSRVEIADKARQETFGSAHHYERNMDDVMSDAMRDVTCLISEKCAEVDMFKNEFDALYIMVKMGALLREYAHPAPRLVAREREKSNEKDKCDEDEDEVSHGV